MAEWLMPLTMNYLPLIAIGLNPSMNFELSNVGKLSSYLLQVIGFTWVLHLLEIKHGGIHEDFLYQGRCLINL
jgi:hypothetical protein